MKSLLVILGFQISIGIVEIIIFQIGAVILGFSIHFFWTSRRSMPAPVPEPSVLADASINAGDEWRLKYYEEVEMQEKLEQQIRRELEAAKDNESILTIELEEVKKELKLLQETPPPPPPPPTQEIQTGEYLAQLKSAHDHLYEHNQGIGRLLEQIDLLKESERKHLDTQKLNETLHTEMRELKKLLNDKESEIKQIRQQQLLTREMNDRLDKAYEDFNTLQEKLQKLESYLARPENRTFEYEELQQSYFKLTKEFDEIKLKQLSMLEENQRLSRVLADAEDKLRESNFQRQQLLKKVGFLEELNKDLQQVAEHNKKLENQLRRLSEIENMMLKMPGNTKI
jgi:DNA repair exonuclease SbcCD ATPase subunit